VGIWWKGTPASTHFCFRKRERGVKNGGGEKIKIKIYGENNINI
jgi:hypothetical protein